MPQHPSSPSLSLQTLRHGPARLCSAAALPLGLALLATLPAQAQASHQEQRQNNAAAPATSLPAPFAAALRKAQIPPEAVAL